MLAPEVETTREEVPLMCMLKAKATWNLRVM